jgi:rhodanese-related sulfurtransferase
MHQRCPFHSLRLVDIPPSGCHYPKRTVEVMTMPFERDNIPQYTVHELKDILKNKSAYVIDVRTPEEYAAGHIPGVPLHPLQEIDEWSKALDPKASYVFVCRSGGRSQKAALYLRSCGFEQVANFDGGMLAWSGELKSGMEP